MDYYYLSGLFSYLCKQLFAGFLQFEGSFVRGQNNSKYTNYD